MGYTMSAYHLYKRLLKRKCPVAKTIVMYNKLYGGACPQIKVAKLGNLDILRSLYSLGKPLRFSSAGLHISDYLLNYMCFSHAMHMGHVHICKWLLTYKYMDLSRLGRTYWGNEMQMIRFLANHGLDLGGRDFFAINTYCAMGQLRIVKWYLGHGIPIDKIKKQSIEKAKRNGHMKMVNYINAQKLSTS